MVICAEHVVYDDICQCKKHARDLGRVFSWLSFTCQKGVEDDSGIRPLGRDMPRRNASCIVGARLAQVGDMDVVVASVSGSVFVCVLSVHRLKFADARTRIAHRRDWRMFKILLKLLDQ
jgi:hypothetical protein